MLHSLVFFILRYVGVDEERGKAYREWWFFAALITASHTISLCNSTTESVHCVFVCFLVVFNDSLPTEDVSLRHQSIDIVRVVNDFGRAQICLTCEFATNRLLNRFATESVGRKETVRRPSGCNSRCGDRASSWGTTAETTKSWAGAANAHSGERIRNILATDSAKLWSYHNRFWRLINENRTVAFLSFL